MKETRIRVSVGHLLCELISLRIWFVTMECDDDFGVSDMYCEDDEGVGTDENRNGFDEDIFFDRLEQDAEHAADVAEALPDGLHPPPIPTEDDPNRYVAPRLLRKWRLAAVNVFCTWPQCEMPKETVLEHIMALLAPEWAIVCHEDHHETDGVHLHAVLHFKRKKNFKSSQHLDTVAGKPGHYEAAKNLKLAVTYVMKDGDWVAKGFDPKAFVEEKKSAKSALIADMVKKDIPLEKIMEKESGFYMMHSKQIRLFAAEWSASQAAKMLTGFQPVVMRNVMSQAEREIGIWLNANLDGSIRHLGKTQLFIHGKTALGKSHLCQKLAEMVKTYFATSCEHFFDGLDETYDLMILDEFHGQQTVTFMNQLLDGQRMVLPQKGAQYHKKKNIPIIICSNYAPKDCYHKVYDDNRDHFDAFLRRLTVVEVISRLDLWPVPLPLQRQNAFRL